MGFGVLDQQGSKRRCTWLMMHLSILVCLKDMFNLQDAATTTLFVSLSMLLESLDACFVRRQAKIK
jgi:hypothetical protein